MLVLNSDFTDSYIDELTEKNGILHWDYGKCPEFILLIQTGYGESLDFAALTDAINRSNVPLVEDRVLRLNDRISCKLMRNVQNKRAYNVQTAPAAYYVVGCNKIDGDYVIYEPKNTRNCSCDIPARVSYVFTSNSYTRKIRKGLRKQEVVRKFGELKVDDNNYRDGALCYKFEDVPYVFAISKEDIANPIYIRYLNDKRPEFFSGINGYQAKRK